MSTVFTPNLNLAKPARGDVNWDGLINTNWDILDNIQITGEAVSFASIPSGSSTSSFVMNSGGSFSFAGTGVVNANQLRGVPLFNQAPLPGQILIFDEATGNYVPGDPIVSGPDAPGTSPTRPPVQIGGFDGTNVQRIKTDTSGNLNVNILGTVPVSLSGSISVGNFPSSQAVTGPLTDSQLRASAVPVTVNNFPSSQAVTGPLTDTQLRASDVSVSVSNLPSTQTVTGTLSINAIPVGSNLIGKVGIDQTTPGTTNKVSIGTDGTVGINAALPSGTNLLGKIAIDQTTPGTTNKVTIGTDGTVGINAALPSGSNVIGHVIADAGTSIIGKVGIDQTTPGTTNKVSIGTDGTVAINAALPSGSNVIGAATQSGTWTVQPGNTPNTTAWLTSQTPATSGGLSSTHLVSAASTNATNVKASSGQIYGWSIQNTSSSARYVKIFNKASSPTVGTDTPVLNLYIPPTSGNNFSNDTGIAFSTGIGFAITSGPTDTDSGAVAASDVLLNIFYK